MSETSSSADRFMTDWGIFFATAGGLCAVLGIVAGWIIWRNTRRFTEELEGANRGALQDLTETSDDIARIRSELADKN